MPIRTKVDEVRRLTVLTVVGRVTFVEMQRAIEAFWESPRMTRDVLWDYRLADMSGLSRDDLERLVCVGLAYRDRHAERAGGRTAIIASEDLEYGLNRVSAVRTRMEGYPFEVRTFRTAEEAEKWLTGGSLSPRMGANGSADTSALRRGSGFRD